MEIKKVIEAGLSSKRFKTEVENGSILVMEPKNAWVKYWCSFKKMLFRNQQNNRLYVVDCPTWNGESMDAYEVIKSIDAEGEYEVKDGIERAAQGKADIRVRPLTEYDLAKFLGVEVDNYDPGVAYDLEKYMLVVG